MRAVTFSEFGGPEVLKVLELPEPQPGPGQIRVKVAAATVNPTDLGFRSRPTPNLAAGVEPPFIPGMELAGTVDAVGEGANWQVGDQVLAIVQPRRPGGGAMAESVVIPAASAARIPEGTSFVEAATLPMNGLTVRQALDKLQLQPGQTLLVTGAAGAVGTYSVELGVNEGLRVIAIASPGDEPMLKQMGAEAFVARGDDVVERVRALYPEGVDAVIDAALLNQSILPAIKDGGAIAAVRGFQGESQRGITPHGVTVATYVENQAALEGLCRLVADGKLTLRVAETFPPERVAEAHQKLEAGGVRGRLVVVF